MKLIDVTVPIDSNLATYSGNTPFSLEGVKRLAMGVGLSRMLIDPDGKVCSRKSGCLDNGRVRIFKLESGCSNLDHVSMAKLFLAIKTLSIDQRTVSASDIRYEISPRLANNFCVAP